VRPLFLGFIVKVSQTGTGLGAEMGVGAVCLRERCSGQGEGGRWFISDSGRFSPIHPGYCMIGGLLRLEYYMIA